MTRNGRFWLMVLAGGLAILWMVQGVLLPFVAAAVLAYLGDPVADRLERRMPREMAALLVLLGMIGAGILALLLLAPMVLSQLHHLIVALPGYGDTFKTNLLPVAQKWVSQLSPEEANRLKDAASGYSREIVGWLMTLVKGVVGMSLAFLDLASLLFVTPVVAWYLLVDWDRLMTTLNTWLPREQAPAILAQARSVDVTLSGFIRGQALVCLALALIYALGLTLAGIDFGFTLGLTAGVLSFIPYVGSLVALAGGVALALVQENGSWTQVAAVLGVVGVGQILEGYVLSPRLVGDRVGLHPVWIIFALLAGAKLGGFLGLLLAVPVAAVLGVVSRYALTCYLESPFYAGSSELPPLTSCLPPPPPDIQHPD